MADGLAHCAEKVVDTQQIGSNVIFILLFFFFSILSFFAFLQFYDMVSQNSKVHYSAGIFLDFHYVRSSCRDQVMYLYLQIPIGQTDHRIYAL